jgi:hypothetical protein
VKNLFKNIVIIVVVLGCIAPLMAQSGKLALLVQKSPEYGGTVTPLAGVNMADERQLIEINAVPKEGYEFVHWLGDVTEPTNKNTTVLLDSPKIVVAVFERAELATVASSGVEAAPASGGGAPRVSSASPSPGLRSFSSPGNPSPPRKAPDPYDPPDPVVPEPATMLILGTGALMLARKRRS